MTVSQQDVLQKFYDSSRLEHKTFLKENVDFTTFMNLSQRYIAYMKKAIYGTKNPDLKRLINKTDFDNFVALYPNLSMLYMLDLYIFIKNNDCEASLSNVSSSDFVKKHKEFVDVLTFLGCYSVPRSYQIRIFDSEVDKFIQNSELLSDDEKALFKTA